jgi:hypothetical protein
MKGIFLSRVLLVLVLLSSLERRIVRSDSIKISSSPKGSTLIEILSLSLILSRPLSIQDPLFRYYIDLH